MAVAAGAEIAVIADQPAQSVVGLVGATAPLERGRAWPVRHSTALSVGVLGVLGVALLLKGLSIV